MWSGWAHCSGVGGRLVGEEDVLPAAPEPPHSGACHTLSCSRMDTLATQVSIRARATRGVTRGL